jgi:hypothetical protein
MKRFTEHMVPQDQDYDTEVEGFNTIVELYNIQHETHRAGLETLQTIAMAVIEMISKENERRAEAQERRITLDEKRFELEEQKHRDHIATLGARKCIATEDLHVVPEEALAAKDCGSAKPKAKSRSRKG